MQKRAARVEQGRGPELILLHCRALTTIDDVRPSAFRRLEHATGPELARFLVSALAAGSRGQRLAA
jgi:hypothetical protein